MDKLMVEALSTFNAAMGDLIDSCADLAELDGRPDEVWAMGTIDTVSGESVDIGGTPVDKGRGGSWERAMGYQLVLTRFAAARAAYDLVPRADG